MRTLFAWGVAIWFGAWETAHYGWNMTAQSDAEMICDGISMLLLSLAVIVSSLENPNR